MTDENQDSKIKIIVHGFEEQPKIPVVKENL